MSLIIKGMKMPQHAAVNGEKDTVYRCAILAHADNSVDLVMDAAFASAYDNGHNIQRYPIAEIPTPHGRLVDADNLVKVLQNTLDNYPDNYNDRKTVEKLIVAVCKRYIENAPTIIEAEVSELSQ